MSDTESERGDAAEGAAQDPAAQAEPAPQADVPSAPAVDPVVAERDRLKDQLLRTAADFDNFRKRTRKDVEDAQRRGKEDAVRELLPVADNLERAVAAAGTTDEAKPIVEGVQMVLRLLQDALEKIGVTRIKAVGERFDPTLHDAIQQVETTEHAPGTIVAELVPGYRMGERLVRAAMVAVARAPVEKS